MRYYSFLSLHNVYVLPSYGGKVIVVDGVVVFRLLLLRYLVVNGKDVLLILSISFLSSQCLMINSMMSSIVISSLNMVIINNDVKCS